MEKLVCAEQVHTSFFTYYTFMVTYSLITESIAMCMHYDTFLIFINFSIKTDKIIKVCYNSKQEGEYMKNNMDLKAIAKEYLMNKIKENDKMLRCTFWEIRVSLDISEQEETQFLKFSKKILENLGYTVYFTGAKFTYENANRTVQSNELIIGIKEK